MNLDRKIKLSHLRLVCSIESHSQISLAADELSITQPAASRLLVELEKLIGLPLFERHARGMTPTPFGQAMVLRAQQILLNLGDMDVELQGLRDGLTGRVCVGAVTGAALGVVIPAVEQLRSNMANADIQINVETSPILLNQLYSGECDFVLARLPADADDSALNIIPAQNESVQFLARKGHPLLSRSKVQLADLLGYEWVAQTQQVPIRRAVDEALMQQGCVLPESIISTTSLLVMLSFLSSSDAVAPVASEVASLLTSKAVSARLEVLPVKQSIQVAPYYLISQKTRLLTPLAQSLMSMVQGRL